MEGGNRGKQVKRGGVIKYFQKGGTHEKENFFCIDSNFLSDFGVYGEPVYGAGGNFGDR